MSDEVSAYQYYKFQTSYSPLDETAMETVMTARQSPDPTEENKGVRSGAKNFYVTA
jgi:hypothetical protein